MRTILAAELLDAWEVGRSQHPLQRGLTLLALIWPQLPAAELASLSIGQRDGALLALREQLFGSWLNSTARCPSCSEHLELTFQVADIRVPTPAQNEQLLQVQVDEVAVYFRSPNSRDLLAIAGVGDARVARQQLLQRCLVTVQQGAANITEQVRGDIPAPVVEQMLAQMAQADAQGDVQLALTCPACKHEWLMTFDILSYLWNEINDWAQRTLGEVHRLATAYSWREADILALSAQRRHFYLAMIGI